MHRVPRLGPLVAALTCVVVVGGCSATGTHTTTTGRTERSGRVAAASTSLRALPDGPAPRHRPVGQPSRRHAVAVSTRSGRPRNHCAANRHAQQVIVSIRAQHMWFCAHRRSIRDTPVTTGMYGPYTSTPTGNFWIQARVRDTTLTLDTGVTYDVKYWIPFQAPLFGFHDASWQRFAYGSSRYRTDGSHGCVHMPLAAIAALYRWAVRATAVHIS